MAKDRMFFLFSIVFLGLVAAFLFRPETLPSLSLPETEGKGEIHALEIMVAEKDLKAGDRLDDSSFKWEKIEDKDFDPTYISRNAQTEKWLKEATLAKNVAKGQKLRRFDILWPQEIQKNESAIQVLPAGIGKRAVPFQLPEKSGIAQFLNPGMFVDISFTSKSDIGFGTVTVTLLKNVRILAVGKEPDVTKVSINMGMEILLEMSSRQAQIFFYAEQTGKVSLNVVESDPPEQKDELVDLLMKSESIATFQSVLVTFMMRSFFPGVDVKITATERGYIVAGKVPDPQIAGKIMEILIKLAPGGDKAIVDLMEVNPQQVLVCVKVFEVSRELTVNLGVNWEALINHTGETVALGATYPPPPISNPNYFFSMNNIILGDWNLSALVNMLQEDQNTVVLADPNLTTVSGQTAHFFAGGEFPILIPQGGTLLGTVTVEYKQYGVQLDLTPTVDLNGLISLRIKPEISAIDQATSVILSGFSIPGLVSRYADTMVKLWSGQSYIIAGMLSDQVDNTIYSLYCLDQLPIIGPLFRSKAYQDQRTELMIIVTPFLINSERTPQNVPILAKQLQYYNEEPIVEPEKECCQEQPETECEPEEIEEIITEWEVPEFYAEWE